MVGTLHKTENGWIVRWSDIESFGYGMHTMDTPIHPDDEKTLVGSIKEIKQWDGMTVEFEYVDCHYDGETFMPVCYAKLLGDVI